MSRWSRFGWYESTPKKPPPERGIRMKKAGSTWWGQRWIEALENVLRGDSARLARGRTYARAGRTHDLVVKGGKVTAKVFDEPVTHGAVLRQLGAPATWEGDVSPADVLAPLVRAAAETARRIAMAEPSDAGESPPPPISIRGRAGGKGAAKRRGAE